jgi:SAM-dependent methyltransferase
MNGTIYMSAKYWDTYYSKGKESAAPICPSQFAAFIASEVIMFNPVIVDIGCGNGRDALFFSQYGFRVIGVDASARAIQQCKQKQGERGDAIFVCCNISRLHLAEEIIEFAGDSPVVMYARFFLHAVSERDERQFFEIAKSVCRSGGLIAVEFRTDKDRELLKVTGEHYRRFINPNDFLRRAGERGYVPAYYAEGFGYAKFRSDDAHVARVILVAEGNSAA